MARRRTRTTTPPPTSSYGSSSTPKAVEPRTETDAALEAGEELARQKFAVTPIRVDEGGRPFRITEDDKVESLEKFLARPVSKRSHIEVFDAASFVDYVNRFQGPASVIFADKTTETIVCVLDYHEEGPGLAGWGRHRVSLTLRQTRAFKTWLGNNKTPLTQAGFAQFIEDNIPDIADPPGARLVEIVRTLQAKKDVAFESNIERQTDGSFKFFYQEIVQGATHRADLKIPDTLTLVLIPYEGSDQYSITARFRFRIGDGGKLSIWYEMVRVEDIKEDAFVKAERAIKDGVDQTFIVNGPAPAQLTAAE
jgi:uncharacterized protein YfdQ (DUF2303 family)